MTRDKIAFRDEATARPATEQGFMLLGLIVAIAIILIALSVAASKASFNLRREREAESVRRANQYVLAIRRYYAKFKHYPSSIEQLEGTNNVRYLRQQYVDPLTGKADYRLIPLGQNKTTVMGFFGEPLGGVASTGLGSAAGMQASNSSNSNSATSTSGSSTSSNSTSSQMGSGLSGTTGPIMGVGSNATGDSIIAVNGQTTYETWEFLYDPRLEQLKLAATMNSNTGSTNANALGNSTGSSSTSTSTSTSSTSGQTSSNP